MEIGKVQSLWRYPVKSILGESLPNLVVDARGVSGDRVYAISNTEGKFASGKDTRRFRRIDGLFSVEAKTVGDAVLLKFPDGAEFPTHSYQICNKLSQFLGQQVTLTREAETPHFDDGPIHILTTASLRLLSSILSDAGIDPKRFRPNIVLDTQYLDGDLIGKKIQCGGCTLEVTHNTERCRMITLEQGDIENRPEILKSVSKRFDLNFGVYARVLTSGPISVGDSVLIKSPISIP